VIRGAWCTWLLLASLPGAGWGCTINATEHPSPRAVLLPAMSEALPIRVGDRVKAHLRRDALGVSGNAPIGLDPDGPSRGDFSLEGTVCLNRPIWLMLDLDDGRRVVTAVDQILFIELLDPSEEEGGGAGGREPFAPADRPGK
jgi:hypothetical protein